jgi:hypothetical protein
LATSVSALFQQQHSFDMRNIVTKTCSASISSNSRRTHDYSSVEEEFFFRLCVVQGTTVYDFRDLMVTATDITIVPDYRNPVITSSTSVTVKFAESCGFLWSERDWKLKSLFRFVAADKACNYEISSPLSSSSYTKDNTGSTCIEYVMYESSLIKYFLDDDDYESTVMFAATPAYHIPFRMCLFPQAAGTEYSDTSTTAAMYHWIDYPDVALFPVKDTVKLSSKNNFYGVAPVETNCPLGWLGCQCNTSSFCEPNYHRALDSGVGSVPATCDTSTNMCVAPTRSLFGTRETYTANPRIVCSVPTPCSNPGPSSGGGLFLRYDSADLLSSDKIRFVQSTSECVAGTANPKDGSFTTQYSLSGTNQLLSGFTASGLNAYFYRMCVTDASGYYAIDYFSTGFTLTNQATFSPTRRTLRPTTWYNKGNAITMSPTKTNPQFGGVQMFPHDTTGATPSKQDFLHITSTDGNTLYTQYTNFSYQDLLSQDTLRVYRDVDRYLVNGAGSQGAKRICTPNWARHTDHLESPMVMELKVNKNSADVSPSTGSYAATVTFPALAKGYYTVCFCRKTASSRCQMTPAGMIYSSSARMVSVAGAGTQSSSFYVTPLLDYEVDSDLFNTTKQHYITANHFCLSNATQGCTNCRNFFGEFNIELTNGGFPLKITNVVAHALGNDDKVYNLCFRDPMLFQWDVRQQVNSSANGYVKEDINNTIWMDQWSFAKIGSVYLSDLSMRWEVNGGFGPTRNTYSISKDSGAMAVMTYTNNNEVIKQNDKYWFAASEDTCDGATSKKTTESTVPGTANKIFVSTAGVAAGHFYRLCVRPCGASCGSDIAARDFGVEYGFHVTDITVSATTVYFFKAFHLSLSSSVSVLDRDEVYLLHVEKQTCSEYSTVQAGWVSPNVALYRNGSTMNLGKMPQVTIRQSSAADIWPTVFAGYRLCVKRTDLATTTSTYYDYAGLHFWPSGSVHIVDTRVPQKTRTRLRILYGLTRSSVSYSATSTVQLNDVVWFNREDTSCAKGYWDTGTTPNYQEKLTNGYSTGSSRYTVLTADFSANGDYVGLDVDFSQTITTSLPFRMCVQRTSWDKDSSAQTVTQDIVQDYPDVRVYVSDFVATTKSPTTFAQLKVMQTGTPSITLPTTKQSFTVLSDSVGATLTWKFTGGAVQPATDKIAIVAHSTSALTCDGSTWFADPLALVPAAAGSVGVTSGSATTGVLGSLGVGKYFVCLCDASFSVTGDCSNELSWRQTVGYVYSIAVQPSDVTVNKLSTAVQSSFTVWFDQEVSNSMRFMLVNQDDACGTASAVSTVLDLKNFAPVAAKETSTATLNTGLTITVGVNQVQTSGVGIYNMCFCSVSPCYQPWDFGGSVSTLIVHDISLNGKQSITTLHQRDGNGSNFTVTQSLFDPAADKIWFARNDCGDGNHVASANITAVQSLPVSGGSLYVDYSMMQASMVTNKLCVRSTNSSRVFVFQDVGFILTDINVTVPNPEYGASVNMKISWNTGLQALDSAQANRVMYFMDTSQACSFACQSQTSTCTVASGSYSTDSKSVGTTPTTTTLTFDFTKVLDGRALRLCVLLDKTASDPKSYIDFSEILVYPIRANTASSSSLSSFYIENGGVLTQSGYPTKFIGNNLAIQQSGVNKFIFFRRADKSCGSSAPAAGDAFTTAPFAYSGSSMAVDFSTLNFTQTAFRLCVVTADSTMLDYSSKTVYLSQIQIHTGSCKAQTSQACQVNMTAPNNDGFFRTGDDVRVWFQRVGTTCSRTSGGPTVSTTTSSQSTAINSLTNTVSMYMTAVTASVQTPLRLCAQNLNLGLFADFPSITLYAIDVELENSYNDQTGTRPLTKWVTPSTQTSVLMKSVSSVGDQTVTWFESTSLPCSATAPTAPTADHTAAVKLGSSLPGGVAVMYDFSQVQPVGGEQVPFRLCFVNSQGVVIDASTVVVHVLEYTVAPGYVNNTSSEKLSISPGTEVNINYFSFCRSDVACVVQSASTTNCSGWALYQPNGLTGVDFSAVESNGKLLRLCGFRQNYASNHQIVDLSPKGVYQGALSIDRTVANLDGSNTVVVSWSSLLQGNTSSVWFTPVTSDCASASASQTNQVEVKPSPFQGSFDFSTFPKTTTQVKLCARVDGVVSSYGATTMSLLSVSLAATSVKAAQDQGFIVTYSDLSAALGSSSAAVMATMSSDATCKTAASATATAAVASVSGTVHSFDFSAAAASADKWVLCLSGNSATVSVDWVSVLVVDVGSLGTNEVNKAVDQKLRLESTVSLVTDDLVWFNSGDVCTSGGATDSNQQKFTGSATYDFDFSKATTSLTAAYKMCVSRSGATMQYSSSSVLVVPQATLGGPFMTGPRAIDVSPLSSFLGSAEVAFVSSTDSCASGQFVSASSTSFPLANAGTYRMCVKTATGAVVDLSSVTVEAKACADLCPASNAGGCDEAKGTCTGCTSHFTGDMCTACAPGYSGAPGCTACDSTMDVVCAAPAADGSCPLSSTCDECKCSGNFDPAAPSRCPAGVCNCKVGYAAPTCATCVEGYYGLVTNTSTGALKCYNCAEKCFKRASSCTADQCVCNDNFDPATSCETCKTGHLLVNGTVCVATQSPTSQPTSAPTSVPTTAPTASPSPHPCANLVDIQDAASCKDWVFQQNFCSDPEWESYVKPNCEASCCQQAHPVTISPTAKATSPTVSPAVADLNERCSEWRSFCTDSKFKEYMDTNCPWTCSQVPTKCSSKPADSDSSCSAWAADYCVSNAWMQTNCATSCCVQGWYPKVDYCDSVTADTTQYDCQAFASQGHCIDSYFSWMKGNCGTTCCNHGKCSNQENKDARCQGWADQGYCTDATYAPYMAINCGQSCFC